MAEVAPEIDKAGDDNSVGTPNGRAPDVRLSDLLDNSKAVVEGISEQARGIANVAVMEIDLAFSSLGWIVAAMVMLGGAALLAWGFLVAAAALMLLEWEISAPVILLLCSLVNSGLALFIYLRARSVAKNLQFSKLRSLISDLTGDNAQ